ncbi:hypothetical protein F511_32216 [Dorcoceras hygrometricum]|uniref:Uncharacterized protein n=1 Tax=Dorcoceras hygrometricum TaxID=472368 RepID=A0A2Z7D0C6_9LAMI|nr:hypothetical protein F511_32216 [Dorcoceras hygrometricum]
MVSVARQRPANTRSTRSQRAFKRPPSSTNSGSRRGTCGQRASLSCDVSAVIRSSGAKRRLSSSHHRVQLIGQRVANDFTGGAWTGPTSRAMREAPRAHAAMVSSGAPPPMAAAGDRLLNCGSICQSGPRPDPRLLRQAALEALTRSARTDSPRRIGRKQFFRRRRRRRGRGEEGAASK